MLRRGVKLLFMKQDIVGTEDDVLHHHILVPLEPGIRRQAVRIDLHDLFPVDGNTVHLAAFRPPLEFTPFLFRGVVRAGWLWLVRLDRGPALLALEPVDLVAQALVLCLGYPQVSHDIFQQIEQLPDELASPVIRNAVQIKVCKHVVAGSSEGRLRVSKAIMLAFLDRGNLPGRVLSCPDYCGDTLSRNHARMPHCLRWGGMASLL